MRPQIIELSSVATSPGKPVDFQQMAFKLGLQLSFGGGVATATVEVTMDSPTDEYTTDWDTDAVWTPLAALTDINTTNTLGNVFFPITGIRLVVTVFVSQTVRLTILQANAPA